MPGRKPKLIPSAPRCKVTISTVQDLIKLSEADLPACLDALHAWIQRTKADQANAERVGAAAATPTSFEWMPRAKTGLADPRALSPTTSIRDLGLRPSAVAELMEARFYALEDFSVETETSLRRFPNVGLGTIASVREMLQAVGLDFKAPTDPYEVARIRAGQARAGGLAGEIDDASSVADLGLKDTTISRLITQEVLTVGKLRAATLRDLYMWFGASGRADVMAGLKRHGLELASKPSGFELWRYKLATVAELPMPPDSAPTHELRPWLGEVANVLERTIAPTVGDGHGPNPQATWHRAGVLEDGGGLFRRPRQSPVSFQVTRHYLPYLPTGPAQPLFPARNGCPGRRVWVEVNQ